MDGCARSEMAWWTAASVIKGREYKSPYDWCQLNNHQGAIGASRAGFVAKKRHLHIRTKQVATGSGCCDVGLGRGDRGGWLVESWAASPDEETGRCQRRARRSLESSRKLSRLHECSPPLVGSRSAGSAAQAHPQGPT
jgi:hypothetical protein